MIGRYAMCAPSLVFWALSSMHWSDWGWETWWPEYNRSLGKPLGSFKREGKYKFSREFERLSVTLDCDGFVTTFQWH